MDRSLEIKTEAQRRLALWLYHSDFQSMSCHGSYMRFNMSLALAGYPFAPEPWMNSRDFSTFVTDEEFYSPLYDQIIKPLFEQAYQNSNPSSWE